MDKSVPLYEFKCAWCGRKFHVCRRDYKGQEYCGDECREQAQAASHRADVARHERSLGEEGKRDRRETRL